VTAWLNPALECLECLSCDRCQEPASLPPTCPGCGQPLVMRYALERLARELRRGAWDRPGAGLWRYRELLPIADRPRTGFNTGFGAVRLPSPVVFDGVPYQYRHTVTGLKNGFKYFTAVTSYDLGNVEIESLESGISQNKTLAIPGPAPGERPDRGVSVFPNPYRVEARWDHGQKVRDHYLWFTNLPRRCTLRIFTLSGDLVFETEFDGDRYQGGGARGIYDPRRELDVPPPTLSGATFGWDLITREGQAAASGLYLFAIQDHASGERSVGKFLIVKSDREEF